VSVLQRYESVRKGTPEVLGHGFRLGLITGLSVLLKFSSDAGVSRGFIFRDGRGEQRETGGLVFSIGLGAVDLVRIVTGGPGEGDDRDGEGVGGRGVRETVCASF